jgi:hypothetical protein
MLLLNFNWRLWPHWLKLQWYRVHENRSPIKKWSHFADEHAFGGTAHICLTFDATRRQHFYCFLGQLSAMKFRSTRTHFSNGFCMIFKWWTQNSLQILCKVWPGLTSDPLESQMGEMRHRSGVLLSLHANRVTGILWCTLAINCYRLLIPSPNSLLFACSWHKHESYESAIKVFTAQTV